MDQSPTQPASDLSPSKLPGLSNAIEALTRQSLPLELDAVAFGAGGRMTRRPPGSSVRFRFHYLGVPFDVEVQGGGEAGVRLTSDLGQLPYTAESPLGRRYARQVLRLAAALPFGRMFLDEDDHIRLEARSQRPKPASLDSVLAATAILVLSFLPYLRLLTEVLPERRDWPRAN